MWWSLARVDHYGHVDDAIERQQARMQHLFQSSIVAMRPVAERIINQIEKAEIKTAVFKQAAE